MGDVTLMYVKVLSSWMLRRWVRVGSSIGASRANLRIVSHKVKIGLLLYAHHPQRTPTLGRNKLYIRYRNTYIPAP